METHIDEVARQQSLLDRLASREEEHLFFLFFLCRGKLREETGRHKEHVHYPLLPRHQVFTGEAALLLAMQRPRVHISVQLGVRQLAGRAGDAYRRARSPPS